MHDNIPASEAVKDSKSMVFLITTVNRRNEEIIVVYEATVSTNTKKLQNSHGGIYKYSFITFRREVIGIQRKTTEA